MRQQCHHHISNESHWWHNPNLCCLEQTSWHTCAASSASLRLLMCYKVRGVVAPSEVACPPQPGMPLPASTLPSPCFIRPPHQSGLAGTNLPHCVTMEARSGLPSLVPLSEPVWVQYSAPKDAEMCSTAHLILLWLVKGSCASPGCT